MIVFALYISLSPERVRVGLPAGTGMDQIPRLEGERRAVQVILNDIGPQIRPQFVKQPTNTPCDRIVPGDGPAFLRPVVYSQQDDREADKCQNESRRFPMPIQPMQPP